MKKLLVLVLFIAAVPKHSYAQSQYSIDDMAFFCDSLVKIKDTDKDFSMLTNGIGLCISTTSSSLADSVFDYLSVHHIKPKALMLHNDSFIALPLDYSQLDQLVYLFINCPLKQEAMIQTEVFKLKKLQVLSLGDNDGNSFIMNVSKLKKLRWLFPGLIDTLPPEIAKLRHLEYLILSGTDVKYLPNKLPPRLRVLQMRSTKVQNIDHLLEAAPRLKSLNIAYTPIKNIPEDFPLEKLDYIEVHKRGISQEFWLRIVNTKIKYFAQDMCD